MILTKRKRRLISLELALEHRQGAPIDDIIDNAKKFNQYLLASEKSEQCKGIPDKV